MIFDAGFGDVFVIRNAGNTNTFGSAGSIEYAVLDLNVRVLVVMSHQGCGAVKAAYLKEQTFSASLTELVTDIKIGLTSHGISTDDLSSYDDACMRHATITASSLMEKSEPIREAVHNKALMIQPFFIDPLAISWCHRSTDAAEQAARPVGNPWHAIGKKDSSVDGFAVQRSFS